MVKVPTACFRTASNAGWMLFLPSLRISLVPLQQGAQIIGLPGFFGVHPDPFVDCFYHQRDGTHGIRLSQVQVAHDRLQIAVDQHMGTAAKGGKDCGGHTVGMVKGKGGKHPLLPLQVGQGIPRIVKQRLVAEHHWLGGAGSGRTCRQ